MAHVCNVDLNPPQLMASTLSTVRRPTQLKETGDQFMKDQRSQCFSNIWDALEDTPQDAANMRLRTELMHTLCKTIQPLNTPRRKVATRLGITELQLNDLLTGKIGKFALDTLIHLDARVSHFKLVTNT